MGFIFYLLLFFSYGLNLFISFIGTGPMFLLLMPDESEGLKIWKEIHINSNCFWLLVMEVCHNQ